MPTRDPNAPPHPDDPPEVRRGLPDSNTKEGQYDPPRSPVPKQPRPGQTFSDETKEELKRGAEAVKEAEAARKEKS